MSEMYFEDNPTDPDKIIISKPQRPRLDQGPDYERGYVDGMLYQSQSAVDKAVNAMADGRRNDVLEEVAREIEKLKVFGDTAASFAVFVRDMKR